jgi:hypothetical protein
MRRAAAVGAVLAVTLVGTEAAAARADNVVSRVSNPKAVIGIGAQMRAGDTTTNRGDSTARASVNRYFLSRDRRRSRGDVLFGRRAVGQLAPGGFSHRGRSRQASRSRMPTTRS